MNQNISTTDMYVAENTSRLPVILLADDDEDDRNLFADAVSMLDLPVKLVFAKDGEELMTCLQSAALPDMLFLDLNMPKKKGGECLKEIKTNPGLASLSVIILSTSINEAKQNQLIEEGAHSCFAKPDQFDELITMLKNTIQLILYGSPFVKATN